MRYSRGVRFVYLKKVYLVCLSAIEPGNSTLEPVVESKERELYSGRIAMMISKARYDAIGRLRCGGGRRGKSGCRTLYLYTTYQVNGQKNSRIQY